MSYSQDSLKSTPSSVTVPYEYIVKANKAYTEVKSLRKINESQRQEIIMRSSEIESLRKSYKHLWIADSLNLVKIDNLETKSDNYQKIAEDYKKAYKKNNRERIGLAISLPVIGILSFLLGFYLH